MLTRGRAESFFVKSAPQDAVTRQLHSFIVRDVLAVKKSSRHSHCLRTPLWWWTVSGLWGRRDVGVICVRLMCVCVRDVKRGCRMHRILQEIPWTMPLAPHRYSAIH